MKISKLFSELPISERIRYVTYFPGLMKDGYIKNNFDENDSDYKKYSSEYSSLKPRDKTIEIIKKCFNLDKYGDLERLSRQDWATQLIHRKKIIDSLGHKNNPYSPTLLQGLIFKSLQNPIASKRSFLYSGNINDLTAGELYLLSNTYQDNGIFDDVDNAYRQIEKERNDDVLEEDTDVIYQPLNLSMIPDYSNKAIISIDLSVNDKQLKEEFSEFLKRKRTELHQKPTVDNFMDSYTGSLIKHSVLQYLDLKILAAYITPENALTHSEYADYIFPGNPSALEKFRDSTVKHSEKAITQGFIHKLLSSINKKQNKPLI